MRRTGVDDCASSLKTRIVTGRTRISPVLPIQGAGKGSWRSEAADAVGTEAAQMSVFPDSGHQASETDNPQPCLLAIPSKCHGEADWPPCKSDKAACLGEGEIHFLHSLQLCQVVQDMKD